MKGLFSETEVNTGRQAALDLAKIFAIVCMVFSHPFEYTGIDITQGIAYYIMFIGAHQFVAPVFMMCMGIGYTYSRSCGDPAAMFRRGLKLLAAGYALNLFRFLGLYTAFLATGSRMYLSWAACEVVIVDILQFAGLATMLLAALRRIRTPWWAAALLALAMSLAGSYIHMVSTGNNLLDAVLAPFIGIEGEVVESYFPLLNWFIFVVLGYGMGKLLRRCKDIDKLYAIMAPIGAIIYLGYAFYAAPRGIGMFDTDSVMHFYQIRTYDVIICVAAMLMIVGICHLVTRSLSDAARGSIKRCASDVLRIYLIQWLFVIWIFAALLGAILGVHFSLGTTLLFGAATVVASILLARVKPFSKIDI